MKRTSPLLVLFLVILLMLVSGFLVFVFRQKDQGLEVTADGDPGKQKLFEKTSTQSKNEKGVDFQQKYPLPSNATVHDKELYKKSIEALNKNISAMEHHEFSAEILKAKNLKKEVGNRVVQLEQTPASTNEALLLTLKELLDSLDKHFHELVKKCKVFDEMKAGEPRK